MNYELSDKAAKLLAKKAVRRFATAKTKLTAAKFDELTVIRTVGDLYKDLRKDNEEILDELVKEQYTATEPHGKKAPSLKWLLALLAGYDAVTKYVYDHEVDRKRDRTAEAINSSGTKAAELDRAIRYWSQMTNQYADTVVDHTVLKAYTDAGIEEVRWITTMDDRECETCRERHRKIYKISELPPKPHWGCRCTYEPISSEKT